VSNPHRTHKEDEKCGFSGLGIKIGGDGLMIWTSKSLQWFGDLDLKITMTVSYFGPQNQEKEVYRLVP
jgi:hypothetical protein